MKKIGLFISLLTCSILLTGCYNNDEENLEEFEYGRDCGIYNNKYPVYMGANDRTELTVAVHPGTTLDYIKNIIGKKYICFGGKNSLKFHMRELPNDAIVYGFSLKIYPNDDNWEKAMQIEEKLRNNENVYEVRISGAGYN